MLNTLESIFKLARERKNNPVEGSYTNKLLSDKSLSKYYNEYFLKKLNDLTPYLNIKKRNFIKYKKSSSPLIETKKINLKREKFSKRHLK